MPTKRTTIIVSELDCAAEQAVLQKRLSALPDVAFIEFDLMNRRLTVTHGLADEAVLQKAVRSVGMTPSTVLPAADAPGTDGRALRHSVIVATDPAMILNPTSRRSRAVL